MQSKWQTANIFLLTLAGEKRNGYKGNAIIREFHIYMQENEVVKVAQWLKQINVPHKVGKKKHTMLSSPLIVSPLIIK